MGSSTLRVSLLQGLSPPGQQIKVKSAVTDELSPSTLATETNLLEPERTSPTHLLSKSPTVQLLPAALGPLPNPSWLHLEKKVEPSRRKTNKATISAVRLSLSPMEAPPPPPLAGEADRQRAEEWFFAMESLRTEITLGRLVTDQCDALLPPYETALEETKNKAESCRSKIDIANGEIDRLEGMEDSASIADQRRDALEDLRDLRAHLLEVQSCYAKCWDELAVYEEVIRRCRRLSAAHVGECDRLYRDHVAEYTDLIQRFNRGETVSRQCPAELVLVPRLNVKAPEYVAALERAARGLVPNIETASLRDFALKRKRNFLVVNGNGEVLSDRKRLLTDMLVSCWASLREHINTCGWICGCQA